MNFNNNKVLFSLILIAVVGISVSIFWRYTFFLSVILIVLALIKHKVYPVKKEFLLFIVAGALGASGEMLIIFSGAWSYTVAQLFNIPLWLPFLWGLAGTVGITFYEGIIKKS